MDKRKETRKARKDPSSLTPLLHVFVFFIFLVAALLVLVSIILNAGRLGCFFIPALALYLAILAGIGWVLNRRKEKIEEHGLMGDELYYELYPVDRFFHEKRETLRKKRQDREKKKAGHRG